PKRGVFQILRPEEHGQQRTLPIVAVEDVWHSKDLRTFERGAAEQSKALGVVRKITRRGSIESIAIEVGRIIHKEKAHARITGAGQDRAKTVAVVERNGDALHHGPLIADVGVAI